MFFGVSDGHIFFDFSNYCPLVISLLRHNSFVKIVKTDKQNTVRLPGVKSRSNELCENNFLALDAVQLCAPESKARCAIVCCVLTVQICDV